MMKFFQRGNQAGLAVTQAPEPSPEEEKAAQRWADKIKAARKYDAHARKQYAIDRKYARGDSGLFDVSVPLAASYIHILKSFLYARNPDIDALPAEATEPPPENEIKQLVRQSIQQDPEAQARLKQIAEEELALGSPPAQAAVINSGPSMQALGAAVNAAQAEQAKMEKQRLDQIMEPYHKRFQQAKSLGETLERVVRHLWERAHLKHEAGLFVSSGLTIAVGWLKCTWRDEMGEDPIVRDELNSLKGQLEKIAAATEDMNEGEDSDKSEDQAEIERQIAGLQPRLQVLKSRGLAIDFVSGENIQVGGSGYLVNYASAPWIAERVFMPMGDAKAEFADLGEKRLEAATLYYPRKFSEHETAFDIGSIADVNAKDADSFTTDQGDYEGMEGYIAVWECWDKDSGNVYTTIEGVEGWAKPPFQPTPTERFYPYFQLAPVEVDGERHPQSLIKRSISLFDEYNRRMSRWSVFCARCIPKTGFDETQFSEHQISKLAGATDAEFVGLKPTRPGQPIGEALQEIAYPHFNPALYDVEPIRAQLEIIWGIQDALASAIQTAKTATEASIENQGSQSRIGYMRDAIDTTFSEMARYTAELALQKMTHDDVKAIAGPWAFWPQGIDGSALNGLVNVKIKAGSSAPPDLMEQQKVWTEIQPLIREDIIQIGQLRGSTPEQIADKLEALAEETMRRTGEHMDIERFMPGPPDNGGQTPQGPQMSPNAPPTSAPPGAPQPQPQVVNS